MSSLLCDTTSKYSNMQNKYEHLSNELLYVKIRSETMQKIFISNSSSYNNLKNSNKLLISYHSLRLCIQYNVLPDCLPRQKCSSTLLIISQLIWIYRSAYIKAAGSKSQKHGTSLPFTTRVILLWSVSAEILIVTTIF